MYLTYWKTEEITEGKLERVSHFLQKAIEHNGGEVSLDWHKRAILEGKEHLLLLVSDSGIVEGLCVVDFLRYENFMSARLVLFSANALEALFQCEEAFHQWCKDCGADCVEFLGRKGWEKICKGLGYKTQYLVMRKKI